MKKDRHREAIDHNEIIAKHFAGLTRLLQEEEKRQFQFFKSQVLDKDPEAREKSGKALRRLVLHEAHYNPSGQRLLTFGLASGRPLPRYSIDIGDIVRLSGFQTPETDRPAGTVYDREKYKITVAFSRRLPGWVGTDKSYELTINTNQTTYDRMYGALREIGKAEHTQPAFVRDISLGLKSPRLKDPVRAESLEFFNPRLNALQQRAVCMAFENEDVLLIHGPPGTGKTSVLIEIIRQIKKRGETVLISAPSNTACDHIVQCLTSSRLEVTRLGHPARMSESLRDHTFSFQMARHPLAKVIDEHEARLDQISRQKERRQDRRVMDWDEKKEIREEEKMLRQDIKNLKASIFQQVWQAADIVIATHTGAGDPLVREKVFQWVIVDEATQGTEPATWIPLSHAGRVILAGDHCQLPPTVFSPKQGKNTLRFTLFERLAEVLPFSAKIRLEEQYRMNEKMMHFSSREFYDGKLTAHPSVAGHTLAGISHLKKSDSLSEPFVFLDTAGLGYEEKISPESESRYNEEEARLVVREYEELLKTGLPPSDIAIISPYSAQVKLLTSLIYTDEWDAAKGLGPEIDSIDAFQGREKEAVIVSLVRSNLTGNLGFLADTRRMNVALTRAKRKLVVIGDSATIASIPFYADFIQYIESIQGYRSAWEYAAE